MNKYKVSYEDKYGDLSHVIVYADDKKEAKAIAQSDNWDCENIVMVTQL